MNKGKDAEEDELGKKEGRKGELREKKRVKMGQKGRGEGKD